MRIEYHRTLIADTRRNEAFFAALKACIEPGVTTVADIGAGTGILGLLAAKLGARKVYLYEAGAVADVAREVVRSNKTRNCEVIPCHSREMLEPPRVDVVVSETLGNYAFEENIIDTLNDARERFLNPGGRIIPSGIRQFVAPVVSSRIDTELRAWNATGLDLDFSFPAAMSLNNVYVRSLACEELHDAAGVCWDAVDFSKKEKANRRGEARWTFEAGTTVYGLAVWWTAELMPGVHVSTAPGAPSSHWEQLYFPIAEPVEVGSGEGLVASIRSRSSEEGGTHLSWSATHLDCDGRKVARQGMDLDKGYLP